MHQILCRKHTIPAGWYSYYTHRGNAGTHFHSSIPVLDGIAR